MKRINQLIKDIERNGCLVGIGQPEALKGDLQGEYSRRINEKDRLVYHVENGRIYIAHCKGHYGDKWKKFNGPRLMERETRAFCCIK